MIEIDNIKYTRNMDNYEGKYVSIRQSLEFHKLNFNNPFYNNDAKQEEKWTMSVIVRRFGQYFIEEDAVCKARNTYMYGTGVADQKGFEHVLPLGSDKAEETGRLFEFIKNRITVDELLFSPICRSHGELDSFIKGKHVYLNEDTNHFFKRYMSAGYQGDMFTWNNAKVDMSAWDFNDHISQVIKPHPIWGSLWKKFAL
jgi:hypothetical protein